MLPIIKYFAIIVNLNIFEVSKLRLLKSTPANLNQVVNYLNKKLDSLCAKLLSQFCGLTISTQVGHSNLIGLLQKRGTLLLSQYQDC